MNSWPFSNVYVVPIFSLTCKWDLCPKNGAKLKLLVIAKKSRQRVNGYLGGMSSSKKVCFQAVQMVCAFGSWKSLNLGDAR